MVIYIIQISKMNGHESKNDTSWFLSSQCEGQQHWLWWLHVVVQQIQVAKQRPFLEILTSKLYRQSHYREVPRWEIFMEQILRFGLDLGQLAVLKRFFSCFQVQKNLIVFKKHCSVRTKKLHKMKLKFFFFDTWKKNYLI